MSDILQDIMAAASSAEGAGDGSATAVDQETAPAAPEAGEVAPDGGQPAVEPAPSEGRARGPDGKFTKAAEPKATPTPQTAKPDSTPAPKVGEPAKTPTPSSPAPTATPAPEMKAPQSWRPAAREKWASLPPEVQQEAVRLDREVRTAMQETAEARRFHQTFQQTVAPYEGMIRAEGGDPLKAVGSLLQTAAALRTAPPAHKAHLVANLVKSFGIPIEALDAALAGEAPPQGQGHAQAQAVNPDAIVAQVMQRFQAQRQQAVAQRSANEVAALADKLEFFEDVREDMADLMEVAARRGIELKPEDAYTRAVQLHPEIAGVLKQREEAAAAKAKLASTQRAREAGSLSVKSQPAAAPPPARKGGSILDDVFAARDRLTE